MTPEVQSYIDAKFTVNFWNQVSILALIGCILIAKLLIYFQLIRLFGVSIHMLDELRVQHLQNDATHSKLDRGTTKLEKKVHDVPDEVILRMHQSAGDGDLPSPPLPPV